MTAPYSPEVRKRLEEMTAVLSAEEKIAQRKTIKGKDPHFYALRAEVFRKDVEAMHTLFSHIDAQAAHIERLEGARESLFSAIAHGDDGHRVWLKQAIDDHFARALNGTRP